MNNQTTDEARTHAQIASEVAVRTAQVTAAVALLDGGATVPVVARYRNEATRGLDDAQLRTLQTRLDCLRELARRRAAVSASIAEQGRLTPECAAAIDAVPTKQELEGLCAPYKPRRRTTGMAAREAGLARLATQHGVNRVAIGNGTASAMWPMRAKWYAPVR